MNSSSKMFMVKSYPFNVPVLFRNEMDGWGSSFSPQKSLCMLMASNKSSYNTVMRDTVLVIVWLNDESLEFAISTLTASQNIICPYLVVFDKFMKPPSRSNLLEKILIIVMIFIRGKNKWHQHWFSVNLLIMGFSHVPVIQHCSGCME
jgi:hypothetical protein